jgi:hypothetical protein
MKRFPPLARAVLALSLLAPAALPSVASSQFVGEANVGHIVVVGDSLMAGFTSGGLVEPVQRHSIGALFYRQIFAFGEQFEQPLASEPGIPPLLELRSLAPVIIERMPGFGAPLNLELERPYNNMAVPGFRVRDVLHTVTGNVVIDLVLRGLGTQLEQVVAQEPTFALVWIGNNDVLGAATSGIVIDGVTLTSREDFEADFRAVTGTLAAVGVQQAMATIPDVTAIPFVTTIPPFITHPFFGSQPVPLLGPEGPLTPDDRVLLTAAPLLAQGIGLPAPIGTGQPLPDTAVLLAAEAAAVSARTAELNEVIREVAAELGAALVDVHAVFDDIARRGYHIGGLELTTQFLVGGIFSLDGIHPTPFGYALVANHFIEAFNDRFNAAVRLVDLFPFLFGDAGVVPSPGAVDPTTARLSAAAEKQLWDLVLNLPPKEELQRLKDELDSGRPAPPSPPTEEHPLPGLELQQP